MYTYLRWTICSTKGSTIGGKVFFTLSGGEFCFGLFFTRREVVYFYFTIFDMEDYLELYVIVTLCVMIGGVFGDFRFGTTMDTNGGFVGDCFKLLLSLNKDVYATIFVDTILGLFSDFSYSIYCVVSLHTTYGDGGRKDGRGGTGGLFGYFLRCF